MIRTHTHAHTYISPCPLPPPLPCLPLFIVCTAVSICKTLRLCAWMSLPHSAGCVQFYAVYLDSAVAIAIAVAVADSEEGLNLGGF